MQKIDSKETFAALVEQGDFLLLKHSSTCPISQEAYDEYEQYTAGADIASYYLVVQEARELSNYIAETSHIKHESPQALLFTKGEVAWHASHFKITAKALRAAVEENK